ncbi:uncharacterized protein TNCV_1542011 [Trichonephila clavipes]|nr:uncharacterized protein TNCV_1542011 [Trichonephila clavipes]
MRTGVVIHKQKFSTHGAPKQTYMLFQNDIPIDVAYHRYTLNMQRCNSGATCAVTSAHITIILESLSKPGDDTLGDSKFLGYFQLGMSTFHSSNNSTT